MIKPYAIARRSVAAYYPETNVLIPISEKAAAGKSNQPASQMPAYYGDSQQIPPRPFTFQRQILLAAWIAPGRVFRDMLVSRCIGVWA